MDNFPEFTYAVVGGGIAGVSAVEQILEFDASASILLISASSVVKEARGVVRLTKTLQDFILVESSLKSFKDVHQSVHVVHDHVTNIDVEGHRLTMKSGEIFCYKKLCICTGGRPNVIFSAEKCPQVIGIRDTESVHQLADKISTAKRVLLIGNGGIATEFVHEVQGVEIIWAIKDKSISAHFIDPGAAEFFLRAKLKEESDGVNYPEKKAKVEVTKRKQYTISSLAEDDVIKGVEEAGSALGPDWHASVLLQGMGKKNVKILYETECTQIMPKAESENKEWPVYGKLSSGEIVGADIIISATGVKPNCGWISASSIEKDEERGIFVNGSMRTSSLDIFAAGDVCFPNWTWAKHWFQMRLWTQARQMGLAAGKSMFLSHQKDLNLSSSSEEEQDEENEPEFCFEIFSHVTRFFGFKVVLLGLYNGQGLDPSSLNLILRTTPGLEYIKIVLQNGKVQGALLIGETGLEETFENLILNQLDVSSYGEELLNPNVDIEDYFD